MTNGETLASVRSLLHEMVTEATSLRLEVGLPAAGADVAQLLNSLRDTRVRLDRVEELLVRSMQLRGQIERNAIAVSADAADAWARAVRAIAAAPLTRGPEFQGPRERYAEADLLTLEQRRDARAAEGLLAEATDTREMLRTLHRGLDGVRQDHVTALRATQFALSLEH
jgi:hypothetical protein